VLKHRLRSRIRLLRSDLFAALEGGHYDLIVTNPPYVATSAMRRLPPEYRHEPRLALAAGRDGLDLVRRIVAAARAYLTPDGVLACEVGAARPALERAYPRLPFTWPAVGHPAGDVFLIERAQPVDVAKAVGPPDERHEVAPRAVEDDIAGLAQLVQACPNAREMIGRHQLNAVKVRHTDARRCQRPRDQRGGAQLCETHRDPAIPRRKSRRQRRKRDVVL